MARQPWSGQSLLNVEVSRSFSNIPRSVGLLQTSDRPVAETDTRQNSTLTRNRHRSPRQNSNQQSQHAGGRRPNPLHRAATGPDTYIMHTNETLKTSMNIVNIFTPLSYEFTCRWPKVETSCDYVSKRPVYNVLEVVLTVPLPLLSYAHFLIAQGFVRYHQSNTARIQALK